MPKQTSPPRGGGYPRSRVLVDARLVARPLPSRMSPLVLAWLVLAPQAGAGLPQSELVSYLALAESYRSGQHDAARRRVLSWPPSRLRAAVSELGQASHRLRMQAREAGEIELGSVEAAVLMHAEIGLLLLDDQRRQDAELHLSVADYLLSSSASAAQLATSLRLASERRLEPRCEPRAFHIALAKALLARGFPHDAEDFAMRARRAAPRDAEVRELAGSIAETQALESQVRNRGKDAGLYREFAERELRAALDVDPARFEARLRLGHVLLAAGRADEAEPLLRDALAQATDARQRYLASLFLGRACDRQGRSTEAIDAYRGALDAWPDSQAARLALGQALEPRSGPSEARSLVAASLADSTRDDRQPDPWWSYPFGRRDDAKESLERLWAHVLEP